MESDTTIVCTCGARVRLPKDSSSRSFRCPTCQQGLAVTVDLKVLNSVSLEAGREAVCPICQTEIEAEGDCVNCPSCHQIHHRECWSEVGGCGTYGCNQASIIDKSDASVAAPLTAWGDTKTCPACGEKIKSIALRCRYCKTDFDSVDPMTAADLRRQGSASDELESLQKWVVGLFVVSLLGLCAPVTLIVSLVVLLPKRDRVKRCGPLYTILFWMSITLSGLYTLMMALFVLFSEI